MLRTFLLLVYCVSTLAAPMPRKTKAVVVVTADGLRWQEIFSGIDSQLMNQKSAGMEEKDAAALRSRLWKDTPEARREALLPFFWGELAGQGVVLGNVAKSSSVRVTNRYRVSYPGYSEIFTGRSQDDKVRGNDEIQNPAPTLFEFLRNKLDLRREQVALFASWGTFHFIGEHTPGSIVINAGYQQPDEHSSARARDLAALQFAARTPWDEARHDYVTFELALDYLRTVRPRVLDISFDETDDWAHMRRYDRVLESIQYFDTTLRTLWNTLQSMPEYRGQTTLVITSDHGRGSTVDDFSGHGAKVRGAEQIWVAIIGPDTPARGEIAQSEDFYQRDIVPTILDLLGIPAGSYEGALGRVIDVAVR